MGGQSLALWQGRCLCLNLIINLPYCEKWVRPELLFFKAKVISVEWNSQLSPVGAVLVLALGVAEACPGVGPTSLVLCLCPYCYFHPVSDPSFETGSPFLGLLTSPHGQTGPFQPGLSVGVQTHFLSSLRFSTMGTCLSSSSSLFLASVSRRGLTWE